MEPVGNMAQPRQPAGAVEKALRKSAVEFEGQFLGLMFKTMLESVDKGPMSGSKDAETWTSFLAEEYGRSFARSGGVGIADSIVRQGLAAYGEAQEKERGR
jgi:flagellar protein FlgJ